MTILERSPTRLSIRSGSTTLTLDKASGKITRQRRVLFWQQKPLERALSDVAAVSVDTSVDRASGVDVCHTMVVFKAGDAWALPAADKNEAQASAAAMRELLGL